MKMIQSTKLTVYFCVRDPRISLERIKSSSWRCRLMAIVLTITAYVLYSAMSDWYQRVYAGDIARDYIEKIACSGCFPLRFPKKEVPSQKKKESLRTRTKSCKFDKDGDGLVIMVSSESKETFRRYVIRQTWGNYSQTDVQVFFVLGPEGAPFESKTFGDIIPSNVLDSGRNKTLMTIFALSWAVENCPDARYVMKVPDDTLVNVKNLLQIIHKNDLTYKIIGNCVDGSVPIRDKTSERYVSYKSYPLKYYPRMCSAKTGYVMTLQTASDIVRVSHHIPFFPLDDIYMSLCAEKLRIERMFFYTFDDSRYYPRKWGSKVEFDDIDLQYFCSCVATIPGLLIEEQHKLWYESQRQKNCELLSNYECMLMKKGIWRILNS